MSTASHDFTGYYTIILTEHSDDCKETITKIFQDCWSLYMANANVLTPTEDYETIILYTFFPYAPDYCERIEAVVQDYFENNTFVYDAPIFPDKFHNFYKCPLIFSTYHFPPLILLKPLDNGTVYIDGIEGTILRVISQRLNFTPNVVYSTTNLLRNITDGVETEHENPQKLRRSLDVVKCIFFPYNTS